MRLQQNESICQVCTSGDYSDTNQIVFCSKCNVSVHQLCYGLAEVPEEDWVCQVCLEFGPKGKYLDCALCSCRGGAMKQVNVHVFDDFVRTSLPEYWARQRRKLEKYIRKLCFSLQVEPQGAEETLEEDKSVPQAKMLIEQDETKIIQRIMRTYQWSPGTCSRPFYDYYKEHFNFDEEELLEHEPVSLKCWIHLSCGLWMPEMFLRDLTTAKPGKGLRVRAKRVPKVRRRKERLVEVASRPKKRIPSEALRGYLTNLNRCKYRLTGLKDISRASLEWECQVCRKKEGASLKCYKRECGRRFHVECAKRAGLTIEAQTTEHRDFILFCEEHTPLRFKKEIAATRKRSRNEIVKFAKNLKKKLKEVLPKEQMAELGRTNAEPEEESLASVREKPTPQKGRRERKERRRPEKKEKLSFEEKVEALAPEKKQLLVELKNELQASKDFFFVWDVNLGEAPQGEGLIHESLRVSTPAKSIFRNKISKSSQIWKALGPKLGKPARILYEKHLSIINSLKVV